VSLAADIPAAGTRPDEWHGLTRIAFRFSVLYFGMYVLLTQMLGSIVRRPIPDFGVVIGVLRTPVVWTAAHVFGVSRPLVITGSGSGDKTFDWVQAFCILSVAAAGTLVWSLLDRRRRQYTVGHRWFHVFARIALGATLIEYGMIKVIPLQMPQPGLLRLIEPFGNFSPMGALWYSIGASRSYEIFAGSVELAAGSLLFVPATALLGAVIGLAAIVQVFVLNMTYDVPVKLFSFHLIVLCLVILAPDAGHLVDAFLPGRRARRSDSRVQVHHASNRKLTIAQLVLLIYILGMNVRYDFKSWYAYGGGAPRPPLFGVWNVDQMTRDGAVLPPLLTDQERWRRVVVQVPNAMTFQRMDDTLVSCASVVDVDRRSLSLTMNANRTWKATFAFDQPAPDRLILDGSVDGHAVRLNLSLFDRNRFLLVSRGFTWIQEYAFNR
jgi:hypothetical protein